MEWNDYRLIDVLDALIDYRGKTPKKCDSGVPLITAKIIKNGTIGTPTEFIAFEDYDSWMVRGFPEIGDVVLTMEAPLGEVAQLQSKDIALAQRVVTLRGKKGVLDNTFLKYFFLSHEGHQRLVARETGTTVTGIKQSELREVLITCPSYQDQCRIAAILSSFDDKIENNNRINANLEAQAQALFKSWFVDFEPWGGTMPEDWKEGHAEEFFTINIGKTPPRKEKEWFTHDNRNCKWVSISDMATCGTFISDSSEYLTQKAVDKFNIVMVPKDSILLSFKLTIGRVAIAQTELTTNEAIARFILPKPIYREYLYLLLKKYNYSQLGSTSSIATAVNSKIIKSMSIYMPNDDILREFSFLIKPLFDQIAINQRENSRLAALRDTLLPKLMKGEIAVA